MAIDLDLDDDLQAIKGLSGTDTTWWAKVAAVCRRLFHSENNAWGPAATQSSINQSAGLPVGALVDYAATAIPDGFTECDGRSLAVADHPALFAAIGTRFGSDGPATFKVPDMRRRQAVGRSPGAGVGAATGAETTVMSVGNLPAHAHGLGSITAGDAPSHGHESSGGYGENANFSMGANQTYTAAPSPGLHRQIPVSGAVDVNTDGATAAAVMSDTSGAHTHAASEGTTATAGMSENISVVSPSITMVKCIHHGVA